MNRTAGKVLVLLALSIFCVSVLYSSAVVTETEVLWGDEGTVIEVQATVESTNLKEGEHTLTISITLISLRDDAKAISFLIVYFRVGEYSGALDFSESLLTESFESLSDTTTFIYDREWGEVTLEISLIFQEIITDNDDWTSNMNHYNYQPYFVITPNRFYRENQYIFWVVILVGIATPQVIYFRRRNSVNRSEFLYTCSVCGFASRTEIRRSKKYEEINFACPNCDMNRYNAQLI
ncbi:MAG: hypothetical protein ACXABK_05835 [Candidatus Heimdallarchaeaceae archaeon]|jgi:hypothetical protein